MHIQRYAQIDNEALATTWALEKWSDFLIGMEFHVETYHKPLVHLLSTQLIDKLPIRIQRFHMCMMRFKFTICHVLRKLLTTADALSQAPHGDLGSNASRGSMPRSSVLC